MFGLRRDGRTQDRRGTGARRGGALQVVLLAALVVGGVAIGVGSAATTIKNFTADLAPASVGAASTSTLSFTLTNDAESNQTLGSANVLVAPGFSVDGSSFTVSRPWSASLGDGVIKLRAGSSKNALPPGGSLLVTFSATAPCATPQPPEWLTLVKQSNNFLGTGNDFTILGDQPSVTVTGGGTATSFTIGTIASPQAVGTPFNVTVTAKDACGNVATSYTGTPTFSGLAGTPTYGALSFVNGVATASVTAAVPQTGAQLSVSDGAITGGPSNAFNVVNVVCTSSSTTCEASDDDGVTSVSAPVPQGNAKLAITFGNTGSGCVSNLLGSTITLDPIAYTSATTVTFGWDKTEAPGTGVANFVLCWSKPTQAAEVLPKCGKHPQGTCELSRSRTGVGDLEIVVRLDPEDPDFELG